MTSRRVKLSAPPLVLAVALGLLGPAILEVDDGPEQVARPDDQGESRSMRARSGWDGSSASASA